MTNTPTADPDYIAPGQTTHVKLPGQPTAQLGRLKAFLETSFPAEVNQEGRQHPEWAADTAIRLLQQFSAHQDARFIVRCPEEYCNKGAGHGDIHGWIN